MGDINEASKKYKEVINAREAPRYSPGRSEIFARRPICDNES